MSENSAIDSNSRQSLTAVSNADPTQIVRLYADPITHRLLTDASGSALQEITATGTVNGSNTVFVFSSVPTYIVADGVWFKATDSNGGVQWSAVGTTITMVNPPATSIYGFS